MVFDAYAAYYDLLYRDKDYAREAAYVLGRLRRHAPQARTVLELGCGTGGHAACLAAEGLEVHGVDLSERMLERAAQRQRSLPDAVRGRLSFERGDARAVRTGKRYDAVIALFHVMSYQTTNADLQAAFATAAEHLAPGGLFLFDFWYGPAVLSERPEKRVKHLEDTQVRVQRTASPVLRDRENLVEVNYSVRIEAVATGKVDEVRERHLMRYLFLPELALLRGPALEEIETLAWLEEAAPRVATWSAFQVLRAAAR